MKKILKAASVSAALFVSTAASAAVLVQIDDDGTGQTRFQLSGTFDLTGGGNGGPGSPFDQIAVQSSGAGIQISRGTSIVTSSRGLTFAGEASNGDFLASSFATFSPSGVSFDGYFLDFFNQSAFNVARLFSYGGPLTGSFDEDITTTIPFASFNTGIFNYGDVSTANQGVRVEVGQAAPVPLPAGAALLFSGLGALALRRRSRKITTP